jgi:20S proteasome alpha/beta subunit
LTLVIAAPGNDFIVLGADSRGVIETGGSRVEINIMRKLIPLTKYTAILIYGAAEEGNQLVEKYKSRIKSELEGACAVAEDFCKFCQNEEIQVASVPKHPDYSPFFGFIVCGLEKKNEQYSVPSLYNLHNYSGFRLGLCRPYAIQGKPIIAHYLFARSFKEDMTVDELCKLVAQSIYDTTRVDGDVGGAIRLAIIDHDGLREISDSDIRNYIETWELKDLKRIME